MRAPLLIFAGFFSSNFGLARIFIRFYCIGAKASLAALRLFRRLDILSNIKVQFSDIQ